MKSILVGSKDSKAVEVILECFKHDHQVIYAADYDDCLRLFKKKRHEFFFLDIDFLQNGLSMEDFETILQSFLQIFPAAQIVVLSNAARIREAVLAVRAGATAYLIHPLDSYEVRLVAENINESLRVQSELDYLRDISWRGESPDILETNSRIMKEVFNNIRTVARTDSTILLTGETGTGKSVLARLIHQNSKRRDKQFVGLHCGAIPETLLESELFGHEKGAFTGAIRRKLGKFEISDGGSIFLDEIGTISSAMQIKLLQILQDRTFQRVGGETNLTADLRVIAATNSDLKRLCEEGKFRQDLYYRLNVFHLEIPPLRERPEDIELLARYILSRLNRFNSKHIHDVEPAILDRLKNYPWPGNIRELENLIERAYILESSEVLTSGSFPNEFLQHKTENKPMIDLTLDEFRNNEVAKIEREYLTELLTKYHGKIAQTAKAAGIGVRHLNKLMSKYGLRKEEFKP